MTSNNLITEFNNIRNPIGCSERCSQSVNCQHWTWWDTDTDDTDDPDGDSAAPLGHICQLFLSCPADPDRCYNCYTGPRSCGLWNTSLAAVSGGRDGGGGATATVSLVGEDRCSTQLTMPRPR